MNFFSYYASVDTPDQGTKFLFRTGNTYRANIAITKMVAPDATSEVSHSKEDLARHYLHKDNEGIFSKNVHERSRCRPVFHCGCKVFERLA